MEKPQKRQAGFPKKFMNDGRANASPSAWPVKNVDTDYILGMAKTGEGVKILNDGDFQDIVGAA
jgi:hypothetical protein